MMVDYVAYAAYLSFVFCVVITILKVSKYARAPMHLRWELYPVPSEEEHKHGGSYLERPEWWKTDIKEEKGSELIDMLKEMIFIKRLYNSKRTQWYFSFLFHGGIYLLLIWFVATFIGSIFELLKITSGIFTVFFYASLVLGYVGIPATFIGAVGLIALRATDKRINYLSAPVDYFNLSLISLIMLSMVFSLFYDPYFNYARSFLAYLISGNGLLIYFKQPALPVASSITVLLICLFLLYLPFTKMTHFLGKYFTYHKVQWDSRPNMVAERFDEKKSELIRKNLDLTVPWDAPHAPKGKRWNEV
jgi:nitrate reductase gamma subunit